MKNDEKNFLKNSFEMCRLSLSLNDVRGPLGQCFSRNMAFHRWDHAAHGLDATSHVQPIKAKS
jgi:hypothetical protein